uniref:NADH dehydrogenase subunit 4L n=1 Tax=Megaulacobothrus chinensis TaxID=454920 RepID=B4XEX9_9ORTH|nr:NADH dehydrogenase subunit 4L [Megaulacobothrus chinensis]ABW16883.1 NADH dehydrogenase subunit 4L [Megaulacobothrus chinensis]
MYVFSIFTSLLLYFSGVYVFSSKRKHLLMVLLSLEYIVLSLFMLIIVFLIEFDYGAFFSVFFLCLWGCFGSFYFSFNNSFSWSWFFEFFFFIFMLS